MKTKSIILIAISLGFGLVAAIGMTQVMGRQKAQVANNVEKEIDVLVAKRDIEINQVVTAEDVVSKRFRPSQVPEGVAKKIEDITDMRSQARVGKGNFIAKNNLVEKTKFKTIEIPKGYSVYSVKPSIESTFLNSLRPGDRIDIIGIVRKPKGNQQVAKTFLKNIRVFGINDQLRRQVADDGEKVSIKLVQVLLRPRQAEQLALVQSVGKIQFVMRPDDHSAVELDDDEAAEEGETGPASLADFFSEGTPVDPSKTGELTALQLKAIQDAKYREREEEDKPFVTTIMTAEGPVQFVYATRTSLPRKMEGNSALDSGADSEADHQPPTTYPPAGVPSAAKVLSPADQGTSSRSSESSSRTEQAVSE